MRYNHKICIYGLYIMSSKRKMLVTSALPYANGHLHLGHLVEHIQTDIWVRTNKMLGHECISICGDDAHGTPIMLKAKQLGITPLELTSAMQKSHEEDFASFNIDYDCYHTTHSEENKEIACEIYKRLEANGDIEKRTISQAFDPIENIFLPDRYVKGTCPKCKAEDQYGDSCEVCGATYSPLDLLNSVSAISGATPIQKESLHYFFKLQNYKEILKAWYSEGCLQEEVFNKLNEWFAGDLKEWDISRDAPYFGFLIPGTQDKYFYVWLDAPIGYMASFKKYCDLHDKSFSEFWNKDTKTELYHFVGKDIIYFHALFWPAMLYGSGYRLPTSIFTHGFLTINGQKMSKSRGTFIEAKKYLEHLSAENLRYYFAAKLNSKVEDIDLNFSDFFNRINADLVGKIVNIASRLAGFIQKKFANKLSDTLINQELYSEILQSKQPIIDSYLNRDYAKAIRQIMECADKVNQYIDAEKPWVLAKDENMLTNVQNICTQGLNLFKVLITYLKPVLPQMALKSEEFLNIANLDWQNIEKPLLNHTINNFTPLMQRVDQKNIDALLGVEVA